MPQLDTSRSYRSEEEYQAAVEARARQIWAEREAKMPGFVQQTWEQGTEIARRATLALAKADLASYPAAMLRTTTK